MINCNHCLTVPATHVFKAHSPDAKDLITYESEGLTHLDRERFNKRMDYCHRINIYLCDNCAETKGNEYPEYDRYIPIRQVKIEPETLSDEWEKHWLILLNAEGYYIFAHPAAKIYYIDHD